MIALDLSLENLYRQYYRCRRNKRNTINALRFEAEQEKNLIALRDELLDRSYQPRRSVCFFTARPKLREIVAADFRDRVVHHLLVDYLERTWEPIFIHDSYACRKGKGVHKGVLRLQQFIRRATSNGTRPAWYLQLDIRNFFMSIDRDLLFAMLSARLRDDTALWLTRMMVYHDVTANCEFRGQRNLLERIPPHKTLFGAPANKGLPIGKLNSQFFANVYLNALDQFVKHELKCRHYLRYCDDFVLLANDPDTLRHWRDRIDAYLSNSLALALNPRQRLAPVSNGIDFLGYIVRGDYLLVRRRVVHNLVTRLREYESRLVTDRLPPSGLQTVSGVRQQPAARAYAEVDGADSPAAATVSALPILRCHRFDTPTLDALATTLSSYLGHLKPANSWRLWQALWQRFDFLGEYFDFDAERWRLVRKYAVPAGLNTVRRQYRSLRWRFPDDALLFRVGRFYEFYDIGQPDWLSALRLQRMGWTRRGACYGFPEQHLRRHLETLLATGVAVILVDERCSEVPGGRLTRVPVCRLSVRAG